MNQLEAFTVAGTAFRNPSRVARVARSARSARDKRKPMPACELRREPTCMHDPNAIRVFIDGEWVGYVPREVATVLAPMLDRGGLFDAQLAHVHVDPHADYEPIRFVLRVVPVQR